MYSGWAHSMHMKWWYSEAPLVASYLIASGRNCQAVGSRIRTIGLSTNWWRYEHGSTSAGQVIIRNSPSRLCDGWKNLPVVEANGPLESPQTAACCDLTR